MTNIGIVRKVDSLGRVISRKNCGVCFVWTKTAK